MQDRRQLTVTYDDIDDLIDEYNDHIIFMRKYLEDEELAVVELEIDDYDSFKNWNIDKAEKKFSYVQTYGGIICKISDNKAAIATPKRRWNGQLFDLDEFMDFFELYDRR